MFQNIPLELQELPQWVCSGPDKLPINPRTGEMASVTERSTWGSYQEAVSAGYQNIGFVLTKEDPYTIIDLDSPDKLIKKGADAVERASKLNQNIVQAFESYIETSQSNTGVHIILRGKIEGTGRRRDTVEVYDTERYMICTGKVIRQLAITDQQDKLDRLVSEMELLSTVDLEDHDSILEDETLVQMASAAVNGEKFDMLCGGNWEAEYESQSEADFALLAIFAYYTKDNEQVRRLFRMTALGKRDKAVRNDKYLNYALSKIRAKELPPVNIDLSSQLAQAILPTPKQEAQSLESIILPPGLVGEIAQYVYTSAIRPVPEVALAAALALTSGICGRSYNISGTGLNQYIILLAKTGSGKEGAASGIDSLFSAVRQKVPMIDHFMGPGAFASGQALVRIIDEKPCFVSVLGEFGLTLQQICDNRANGNQIMLRRVLLDLYSKSGWNKMLRPSVYSDAEKNTKMVQAPNITILGESTPETFYAGLDQSHIAEGLIPRFSIIEYIGKRPPRNPNAFGAPDDELIKKVSDLATVALSTSQNNTCAPVQTSPEATVPLDALDRYADGKINNSSQETEMQLWNRAHLKALKMAALIAVGVNPHQPIITKDIADWSIDFVKRDINTMVDHFASGDVGQGDHKQELDIRRACEAYFQMSKEMREGSFKVPKAVSGEVGLVPYPYLRRKLKMLAAFKNDRRGATMALSHMLEDMVKAGVLNQVPPDQVRRIYKVTTILYSIGDAW